MELFLQAVALVLIAAVLGLMIGSQQKHMAVLLSLAVCCMVCVSAVSYLTPVVDFLRQLQDLAGVSNEVLTILLKAAGISLLSELAVLICSDAGESVLGKAIQLLTNGALLWISLPLLEQLVALLQEVLSSV